jgi:hypothetical protein
VNRTTPTLDAIIRDVYTSPVEDGMPPSSKLGHGLVTDRDGYYVTMYAPAFDAYSYVAIAESDVRKVFTNTGAMIALLERKLGQLRQMHHFACLSKRGGYY